MKSRLARLGVLLGGLLGLMATMTPAEATTIKTVTFTGTATLAGGTLGYPCAPAGTTTNCPSPSATTKPGPKGVPVVNITPGGNHAQFDFNSLFCFKDSYSTPDKQNQKNGIAEPCLLLATGAVWGFCGLSTGQGVATLINLAGTKGSMNTISSQFKFTGIGGVLHVTGGNDGQWLVAEVVAVPVITVGGPTCTAKTADAFTLTGTATLVDKTPPLD